MTDIQLKVYSAIIVVDSSYKPWPNFETKQTKLYVKKAFNDTVLNN
jgi:hypothetical protein